MQELPRSTRIRSAGRRMDCRCSASFFPDRTGSRLPSSPTARRCRRSSPPRRDGARTEPHPRLREHRRLSRARRTITSGRPLADTPTASREAGSTSMARRTGSPEMRESIIFTEGTSVSTEGSGRSDGAPARARRASPLATTAPTGKRGIRVPLTSRSSTRSCVRTRCGSDTERARIGGRSSI